MRVFLVARISWGFLLDVLLEVDGLVGVPRSSAGCRRRRRRLCWRNRQTIRRALVCVEAPASRVVPFLLFVCPSSRQDSRVDASMIWWPSFTIPTFTEFAHHLALIARGSLRRLLIADVLHILTQTILARRKANRLAAPWRTAECRGGPEPRWLIG